MTLPSFQRGETSDNVYRIRIIAPAGKANKIDERLVALLEGAGFQIIEWSSPKTSANEPGKERVYVSAQLIGLADKEHKP